MLSIKTLENSINEYFKKSKEGYDSLFSVTRVFKRYWSADCKPVNHDPKILIRTQDLPPFYEENSLIYIFSKQSLKTTNSRIGDKPILFETPSEESIDIDNMEDFRVAQYLHNLRKEI